MPPLVGPGTAVCTLQNGLGNEDQLARLFPGEQILGGMCFVCLNRVAPGVIHHLDHGLIVLGEFQGSPRARTERVAQALREARVPCSLTENLARAHWEKLVWNIPFNGLGVAAIAGFDAFEAPAVSLDSIRAVLSPKPGKGAVECVTTDRLLAEPRWETLLRDLMAEVILAAHGLGFDLTETLAEQNISRTRSMGPYKASTLIDFERGLPLELESLFLEPFRQARKANVPVPRLARLCEILFQLDTARRERPV